MEMIKTNDPKKCTFHPEKSGGGLFVFEDEKGNEFELWNVELENHFTEKQADSFREELEKDEGPPRQY